MYQPPPGPPGPPYPPPYYPPPPQVVVVHQVVKAPFSHTIHVVLDVLSCGAWLPIHLICWACH